MSYRASLSVSLLTRCLAPDFVTTFTVYVPRASERLSRSLTVEAVALTLRAAAEATARRPRSTVARTVPAAPGCRRTVSVRPLSFAAETVNAAGFVTDAGSTAPRDRPRMVPGAASIGATAGGVTSAVSSPVFVPDESTGSEPGAGSGASGALAVVLLISTTDSAAMLPAVGA